MVFSCTRRRGTMLCVAAVLILLPASGPLALTVTDLVDFLESDVPEELLLRLLDSSGAPKELTPADLVALWDAGASKALLDRLVPPTEPEPAAAVEPPPVPTGSDPAIRAYYRDEPDGGQVFVLTNLDDEGQRLDGRPSGARANLVTGSQAPPEPEHHEADFETENLYAAAPAPFQAPYEEKVVYPRTGPSTFVQTSPYFGFAYSVPASHLYPPGSYTHFKLYHQGGRKAGLGHYQLPAGQIFYQPPFPTAGSHRIHRPRR